MPVSKAEAADVLAATVARWVDDPESAVEYSEVVAADNGSDYLVIRMRQDVRDYTSVWFQVGERSLRTEAYVLPAPPSEESPVFRQCLVRNQRAWRAHFMVGADGGLVLAARTAIEHVTELELELLLAEIYEAIEVSFRPLIRAGWDADPDREK